MSLIGAPLPSATYAGYDNSYYAPRDANGQLVGVTNLNGLIGQLAITGDTSIGITTPGLGAIQVSTAGLPQVPSSVTATGAIVGATVTATGVMSAASATVSGTIVATGSITAPTFMNSTPSSVVSTTPVYGATPPADATQIFTGDVHAQTATTFSVAALAAYKSLAVSFAGGAMENNSAGAGSATASLYLCGLAAVPAVGTAIVTNVYVPIVLSSQFTQLTMNNSTELFLNVVPANAFNQQQLQSVVIPYPTSGTLTVWDFCSAGANHTWLSGLIITVRGIL
jgi:hypothetical protein